MTCKQSLEMKDVNDKPDSATGKIVVCTRAPTFEIVDEQIIGTIPKLFSTVFCDVFYYAVQSCVTI